MNIIEVKKPQEGTNVNYKFVLTQGHMGTIGAYEGDYAVYHGVGTVEEVASYGNKLSAKGAQMIFPEYITSLDLYRV